ncbi:MAG: phosphotransferase family protein [Dehalococcoidia bacterium]
MIRQQDIELALKGDKLKSWLKTKLPQASNLSIGTLKRASSGFSNETYFFDLRWQEAGKEKTERLVVRWAPETHSVFPDYDLSIQYRVMQCLKDSGISVPKVFWFEADKEVLGLPFYVMERIDGEIISDSPPGPHAHGFLYEATPERRAQIWWRAVEATAKIHSLDWKRLGLSFLGAPKRSTDTLDTQIAFLERMLKWGAPGSFPVLEAGFDWVKKNKYKPERVCLCWGDARYGNIIYRDDKVETMLDWELAHIGPPESDLAYFLFIDQQTAESYRVPRLEGLPTMEETIRYYEKFTGKKVENFFYHQVFQSLKLAVFVARVATIATELKIVGYPPDMARNNWAANNLEKLLGAKRSS